MGSVLYKIVPAAVWKAAESTREFSGASIDIRDGFIHFSTAAQVRETAARHFAGMPDLLLVAVAPDGLDVRWERSRNDDLFPHLYGPLPLAAVLWARPLPLRHDGTHEFDGLVPRT